MVSSNYVLDKTAILERYPLGWDLAGRFGDSLRPKSVAVDNRPSAGDERSAWDTFVFCQDQSFSVSVGTWHSTGANVRTPVDCDQVRTDRVLGLACLLYSS